MYGSCNGNCNRTTIYVDDIHNLVEQEIIKKLEELKDVEICIEENNDIKIEIAKIDKDIKTYSDKILMANEAVMKIINERIEELNNKKRELLEKSLEDKINCNIDKSILNINFLELSLDKKRDIACILIDKVIVNNYAIELIFKV